MVTLVLAASSGPAFMVSGRNLYQNLRQVVLPVCNSAVLNDKTEDSHRTDKRESYQSTDSGMILTDMEV